LITSTSNARLKNVRRLARRRGDTFLVEGGRAVRAALAARADVHEIYAAPELFIGAADERLVARARVPVVELGADAFRSISTGARPDGLAAIVGRWQTSPAMLDAQPLVLVADGIERPGNLGTIVRTAAAAVSALLVSDAATDLFHPEVVRGSVGTLFGVPLAQASGDDAVAWARRRRVVVATPDGDVPYWDCDYRGDVALVVGSERNGVGARWLDVADVRVAIPMAGAADSLNVAVAAGIVLFEAARQRCTPVTQPVVS
jgi:TrmH family RNA methyltransferase